MELWDSGINFFFFSLNKLEITTRTSTKIQPHWDDTRIYPNPVGHNTEKKRLKNDKIATLIIGRGGGGEGMKNL